MSHKNPSENQSRQVLVICRHAHRDIGDDRERDNGLSDKGKEQARALGTELRNKYRLDKAVFLTSPRKRCKETLEAVHHKSGAEQKVEVEPKLDERNHTESSADFVGRLRDLLQSLDTVFKKREPSAILFSSHGDVIPEVINLACGKSVALKKGAYAVLTRAATNGDWDLDEVVQEPGR